MIVPANDLTGEKKGVKCQSVYMCLNVYSCIKRRLWRAKSANARDRWARKVRRVHLWLGSRVEDLRELYKWKALYLPRLLPYHFPISNFNSNFNFDPVVRWYMETFNTSLRFDGVHTSLDYTLRFRDLFEILSRFVYGLQGERQPKHSRITRYRYSNMYMNVDVFKNTDYSIRCKIDPSQFFFYVEHDCYGFFSSKRTFQPSWGEVSYKKVNEKRA